MTAIRKHYPPAFKAQVVQEILAGERPLAQIAAHHGVHPNMISKWKRAALRAMPSAFTDTIPLEAQIEALKAEHEREKEQLYAEIGRLSTQVRWLQKKIAAVKVGQRTNPLCLVLKHDTALNLGDLKVVEDPERAVGYTLVSERSQALAGLQFRRIGRQEE